MPSGKTVADLMPKPGKSGTERDIAVDVQRAEMVQLRYADNGKVWLNVDGVCVFRCGEADNIESEGLRGSKLLYQK